MPSRSSTSHNRRDHLTEKCKLFSEFIVECALNYSKINWIENPLKMIETRRAVRRRWWRRIEYGEITRMSRRRLGLIDMWSNMSHISTLLPLQQAHHHRLLAWQEIIGPMRERTHINESNSVPSSMHRSERRGVHVASHNWRNHTNSLWPLFLPVF